MDSTEAYAEFLNKVKSTIYLDNISPTVTELVLRAAFNQFGNVRNIDFISPFMQPNGFPRAALVEMESIAQAKQIIAEMDVLPFMVGGMPRPVRARFSTVEMFDNRPSKPERRIRCQWLNPKDPNFKVAMEIKNLVKKHDAEAAFLLEKQLDKENELAQKQDKTLEDHIKKLKAIEGVCADGSAKRLANYYRV